MNSVATTEWILPIRNLTASPIRLTTALSTRPFLLRTCSMLAGPNPESGSTLPWKPRMRELTRPIRQTRGSRRRYLVGQLYGHDLGYIDLEEKTVQPLDNPLVQRCKVCLRNVL